jgi:hypothetical protein
VNSTENTREPRNSELHCGFFPVAAGFVHVSLFQPFASQTKINTHSISRVDEIGFSNQSLLP